MLLAALGACKAEKPVEQKKPAPVAVVKPKHPVLSDEQRTALGFPTDIIAAAELSAGSEAEPFFATVLFRTENLKGDQGIESKKLAGFSVRARNSDDLMDSCRASLRARGYLIFKSQKGYGSLPDIVTIIKGNNSYDVLKIQGTEAPNYNLDTKAIIAWLKARQQEGSFVVSGAGPDWLEARFIKPPKDLLPFARKIAAFAPDVLTKGHETAEQLVERMKHNNGFYLVWD
jgi:hypothetical protein